MVKIPTFNNILVTDYNYKYFVVFKERKKGEGIQERIKGTKRI